MATHKRWNGSAFTTVSTFKRWNGSAFVDVTTVKRWNGTAWVDTAWGGGGGSLSATVSPGSAFGEGVGGELAEEITTNSVTVTPSGGTGPYTYAWTRISGSPVLLADDPTLSTTTFTGYIYKGSSRSATFRCTVTDSVLATATVDVVATIQV